MCKQCLLSLLLITLTVWAGHSSAQGIINCPSTDCPGCKEGLSCTGYPLDITEGPDAVGRCSFDGQSGCLYCSDTDPCPGTGWQCTRGVAYDVCTCPGGGCTPGSGTSAPAPSPAQPAAPATTTALPTVASTEQYLPAPPPSQPSQQLLQTVAAEASAVNAELQAALQSDASLRASFDGWQSDFGQSFQPGTAEYDQRLAIFKNTLQRMVAFNQQPGITYWVAPNRWSALTFDEFAAAALGGTIDESSADGGSAVPDQSVGTQGRRGLRQGMPSKVDWTAQGKVTQAKDQNPCGSCWSFAAVAAVESKLLIQGGPVGDFSEQLCLDCVPDGSCAGGPVADCLQYIAQHGVPTEDSYEYTAKKGQCQQASQATAAQTASPGYTRIQSGSRDALRQAVAAQPTVMIFKVDKSFQDYGGAVYTGSTGCGSSKKAHFVLVTGYEMPPNDVPFWIVKLSSIAGVGLQTQCTMDWVGGNCPKSCAMWGKQVGGACARATMQAWACAAKAAGMEAVAHKHSIISACGW
ncbi:hypothetical protein COHA_003939 [Chlorella ohadii]|uniref:Peptidase C1A papain C-terminal domain-containing protein n=1 Tax=Chlorella ohadii TaxID=2649997 RepID=A0AAD5H651_9CHLO|nr:hypothetical protein COHA_003939 [Chlorella ohadii]